MSIKFSIITVCLNAGNVIGTTIESVLNQSYVNFELIIKDGISSDDTLKKIPKKDKVRVYSQRDNNLYDAMNQAIRYARGDYLIFLNAGDVFFNNDVLMKVAEHIQRNSADIYYGNYCRNHVVVEQPASMSKFTLFRNPLNHQSMFFKKDICGDNAWYDEQYRILADYDLTVRSFFDNKVFFHIPITVDIYEGNGVSESKTGVKQNNIEMKAIRKKYFEKDYLKYAFMIQMSFPNLRKFLVKDTTPRFIIRNYRKLTNMFNRNC